MSEESLGDDIIEQYSKAQIIKNVTMEIVKVFFLQNNEMIPWWFYDFPHVHNLHTKVHISHPRISLKKKPQ